MKKTQFQPYILQSWLDLWHQGKVRETYETNMSSRLAQVATNRVSTHNKVHKTLIPHKGEVLNILTVFWLTEVMKGLPNHLVAWGREIYDYFPVGTEEKYPDLHYRTIVVEKLDMIPVEFIPRRFLTGSMLKYYLKGEDKYGVDLPPGLTQMSRFESLVFTATEKSETDDPVKSSLIVSEYPDAVHLVLEAYQLAEKHLANRGVTIVDSKFEVGCHGQGKISYLSDEVITPDSSRFTKTNDIAEGEVPNWLDKQFVRDYVELVCGIGEERSVSLSDDVVLKTTDIYKTMLHSITDRTLDEWKVLFDSNT